MWWRGLPSEPEMGLALGKGTRAHRWAGAGVDPGLWGGRLESVSGWGVALGIPVCLKRADSSDGVWDALPSIGMLLCFALLCFALRCLAWLGVCT